jgi:hypothetical protein
MQEVAALVHAMEAVVAFSANRANAMGETTTTETTGWNSPQVKRIKRLGMPFVTWQRLVPPNRNPGRSSLHAGNY